MPTYQGRALRSEAANRNRGPRGPLRRLARVARVVVVLGVITALAHVPWGALRHAAIRVAAIRVAGLHYLDAPAVVTRSGLTIGMGWLDADLRGARQRLLSDSRIRSAKVSRTFPNGIDISVEERVPVLLVRHGSPWELDADGVLMAPLKVGVVADVPLVAGFDAGRYRAGTCLATPEVQRALAWVGATADPQLELAGRISEFDVSDGASTAVVLMDGTRVLAPAWPPGASTLSSLRVVLASLGQRGIAAQEIDLRYKHQVIVRPATVGPGAGAGPGATQPS
jgi:cell division protein FtsQ